MKTELEIMKEVEAELQRRGYHVTIEYPGFLSLANVTPGKEYAFGTANETWGYDIIGEDNEPVACGASDIPVKSEPARVNRIHLAHRKVFDGTRELPHIERLRVASGVAGIPGSLSRGTGNTRPLGD